MKMVKIRIEEDPNRVYVEFAGEKSHGDWDEGEVSNVQGDEAILLAALSAWTGQEGEWEITAEDLELFGGGYWAVP